ncbi:hypothetical protein V2J09_010402 [Rumex salicifolius]
MYMPHPPHLYFDILIGKILTNTLESQKRQKFVKNEKKRIYFTLSKFQNLTRYKITDAPLLPTSTETLAFDLRLRRLLPPPDPESTADIPLASTRVPFFDGVRSGVSKSVKFSFSVKKSEMGFIFGLVIGIFAGIAAIVLFVRCENARSKQRSDLAATIAAFARMTVGDSRKLLPPPYYPSWVVFSQRQKLSWLNAHLTKIWPYVDQAASVLIKTSVEPVLESYRPIILSSLKFSKLTLGTVAPQFTGISIVEDGDEGVTMELEMNWDGNPSIILAIKTRLGVALPVQVKDIGFTGVFRIILKPLVEELPCFGAISYSLREKKKMDFSLKVVGGDISSIPGLHDAIEGTIRDAIEDSIMWPVRKIIPIVPGDYSDLELRPVGRLEVKLVQARELTNKDLIGKSDPFAVLYVRPIHDKKKTSRVISNDLNPIWNEHYEFVVEDKSTQNLTVKIFDDEGLQAAELLGCARVHLKDLEPGKVKDVWLKLVKDLDIQRDTKNRGEVHLELLYFPSTGDNGDANIYPPNVSVTSLERVMNGEIKSSDNGVHSTLRRDGEIVRGVLSVTIMSAEDLPATDITGKSDPYVVVKMKKTGSKNKTRVVNESLDPVWNQTFDFLVENGLNDMLVLEVYDHDTFGKASLSLSLVTCINNIFFPGNMVMPNTICVQDYMGRCIVTLTRVIMEGEYEDSLPLEGAKKGRLNISVKWTSQTVYRNT